MSAIRCGCLVVRHCLAQQQHSVPTIIHSPWWKQQYANFYIFAHQTAVHIHALCNFFFYLCIRCIFRSALHFRSARELCLAFSWPTFGAHASYICYPQTLTCVCVCVREWAALKTWRIPSNIFPRFFFFLHSFRFHRFKWNLWDFLLTSQITKRKTESTRVLRGGIERGQNDVFRRFSLCVISQPVE